MMKKYLVITSFASIRKGSHAAGETLELNAEDARDLAPFLQLVDESGAIETADVQPIVETADIKSPRKPKK